MIATTDRSEGSHEAASDLLLRLEAELDARVAALTDTLEEVEDGEPVLRSALGAILGAAAGLFDRVRLDTRVSRMLRDDYAALSFAAVCYEMLHTTALDLGDDRVAELALRHLAACARSIARIGDLMPAVLLAELHEEEDTGAPVPAVVEQAQRNVRAAWTSDTHEVLLS